MTHVDYHAHVEAARRHLGDRAPLNTCVSKGMRAWPAELGLATLDTDSVTESEHRARQHYHGWRYVEGTAGIRPGYYADWKPSVLGSAADRHVCVVEQVQDGLRWRGIGAGTPSGEVAYQPASGGTNALTVLQGYFIPPTETAAPPAPGPATVKPAAAPAAAPAAPQAAPSGREHVVQRGDTVWALARRYGVGQQALLRANPPLPSRRSADYHIVSPSLIVVGQRIRIP